MESPLDSMCIKDGMCLTPDGRPMANCPTRRQNLERYMLTSPLLTPEQLCLRGIDAQSRKHMSDPFKELCRDIEDGIERTLAMPGLLVREQKDENLRAIAALIAEAQSEPDIYSLGRLPYALRLQRYGIVFPALIERNYDGQLQPPMVQFVHQLLCQSLEDFDAKYVHRSGMHPAVKKLVIAERTEREVFGLLTRLGDPDKFPWPTTNREEASPARSDHNHDGYCLQDGKKVPFQIKESKHGHGYKGVVIIRHYDILRAMHTNTTVNVKRWQPTPDHPDFAWPTDFQYQEILRGTKPDPIGQLLIEEMREGKHLDPKKRTTLNLASAYVVARLNEFSAL